MVGAIKVHIHICVVLLTVEETTNNNNNNNIPMMHVHCIYMLVIGTEIRPKRCLDKRQLYQSCCSQRSEVNIHKTKEKLAKVRVDQHPVSVDRRSRQ